MKWPYNPNLISKAQELRQNMTKGEALLWRHLKNGQRNGFDFHRQKPIDEFIVDFVSAELCLAIEIDGTTHNNKIGQDQARQARLESFGLHFLRFQERHVLSNLEGVLTAIDNWIRSRHPEAFEAHAQKVAKGPQSKAPSMEQQRFRKGRGHV